ncbi:MAG: pyruvate, phosphate dikinase [Rhodobacteraceae bacterium]|uniref:Pyruvate, phosphate dikinase n=1 Tax=Salipiger profundus TaxID=1229727 RepID=A0A1U7D6R1_9RHOB|nr:MULTISPECIES: putative PEP-binding protein [Salipiger]APX23755.1 pyruvate phosphate dikinase [Salipiger profundus]MAB07087.1 pyruvate, phosphate dikinase [Paracoccaceae bacterium]GGA17729.1 pyruvate, phosphate dikinase [Salipiger profundus]SFD29932.1 pyruvate phosphate dikinase [Salipiger profundus]
MPDTHRQDQDPEVTLITPTAPIATPTHGGRAKCLQRLVRLDLPVPRTVALSFDTVHRIAKGAMPDIRAILDEYPAGALLCVRPSSEDPDWGGPGSVLNIGMNDALFVEFSDSIGPTAASALYKRFVTAYAIHVARLDPDVFEEIDAPGQEGLSEVLRCYEEEAEEPFPQDPAVQLAEVLRSMARAWEGTTARLLRQAKGAPMDAGLGLIVQEMALGVGDGECGSGVLQLVNSETGLPQITGRYLSQSQGREALKCERSSLFLERDPRGPSLEEQAPDAFRKLKEYAALMREKLRAEMQIEFTIENGQVHILDGVRVKRSPRAALRIALRLAEDGIISRQEALMRVEPRGLTELLHRQLDPEAERDRIGGGVAASPGAATGRIVFSSSEAQASAARGENCILVRRETSPEDVRGMHAAVAVLTERGGMTSHAAVIGRGLGLPCVVGAARMGFRHNSKRLVAEDGREFGEGDIITVDGTSGQVLAGAPKMIEAALDDAFQTFMSWADEERDIGVRANADTPADAATARNFAAQGIGLCRTEHMFFEADRITPMREMIFADSPEDRKAALARLLPMQRADFTELFRIMEGMPVCIRLFDPPLHEFLPSDRAGLRDLAEALDLPVSDVTRRVESMGEYNPMLGMRGVRLGIAVPEIYDMQARAIFEATLEASRDGAPVVPEIMLPLVSACREVELVRTRIDAVAAAVRNERGREFDYSLGVMVETPRACLRADEIAQHAHFLSFGTNDLTQMTYGLSRDDAGRFMSDYVQQGVFAEDPFHRLDSDGVGELIRIGVARGREGNGGVMLSICGEHGGDPDSIAFCRDAGIDYVSCSPFRVPVARLAAAQLAIRDKIG